MPPLAWHRCDPKSQKKMSSKSSEDTENYKLGLNCVDTMSKNQQIHGDFDVFTKNIGFLYAA